MVANTSIWLLLLGTTFIIFYSQILDFKTWTMLNLDYSHKESMTAEHSKINQSMSKIKNTHSYSVSNSSFEQLIYLQSAYLDCRFSPPKTLVLLVLGKTISSNEIQCYSQNSSTQQHNISKAHIFKKIPSELSCYFEMYIYQCNIDFGSTDYISITFKDTGKCRKYLYLMMKMRFPMF